MRTERNTPTTSGLVINDSIRKVLSTTLVLLTILMLSSCSAYRSSIAWPTENETATSHTIHIYKLNKLILIKGEVNGVSGYFIFDTGAPDLILNENHFENFTQDPTRQVTGVNGQIHDARVYYVHNLKLGNLNFKRQVADVIDLSHIEEKRNVKILGLLGVNLFKGEELEIDLQKRLLRIFKTDKQGLRLQGKKMTLNTGIISLPFRYSGALIELEAHINNRAYRIAFDTGSETLLLDKSIMARDRIQTSLIGSQDLLSTDGSGSGIEIRQLDKIKIGLNLKKVTTVATDLKRLRAYGLNVDGLIGYDLMASGVVTINFSTRTLQIIPYNKA